MLGGQESCSRRLVALWAAITLACATAASAGEIIFDINPVQYDEFIARYAGDIKVKRGTSAAHAEKIEMLKPYTYSGLGHHYDVMLVAETKDKGPASVARALIKAYDPGDQPPSGVSGIRAEIQAYNRYQFVAYNLSGTETGYAVPLIVKGTLSATSSIAEYGNNPYTETVVRAGAGVSIMRAGYPDSKQSKWVSAEGPNGSDKKPFIISSLVWVDKEPGENAWMEIYQFAYVAANATAQHDARMPDQRSYSTAVGVAKVDPVIYVDPTWEHADEFGLAFPDNVTFMIPEPATFPLVAIGAGLMLGACGLRRRRAGHKQRRKPAGVTASADGLTTALPSARRSARPDG